MSSHISQPRASCLLRRSEPSIEVRLLRHTPQPLQQFLLHEPLAVFTVLVIQMQNAKLRGNQLHRPLRPVSGFQRRRIDGSGSKRLQLFQCTAPSPPCPRRPFVILTRRCRSQSHFHGLASSPNVFGASQQRLWHSTIDSMSALPDANLQELALIRDWITNGISLDFESIPLNIEYENTSSVDLHVDAVRSRLKEYVDFGAVLPLSPDHPLPFGVQPLHVIIKTDKKPRLVIDLSRNLNNNLHYEYFSYSSVNDAADLSFPGCWYGKLDLSNCFLSFPLNPSAYPHFIFCFEEQLYQFVRMPFGLSSAPRICTLLLSVVHHRITQQVLTALVRYLDDLLFICSSQSSLRQALMLAQQIISDFGLVVNQEKTEGPSQCLSFLGVQLDSVHQPCLALHSECKSCCSCFSQL
jgi:hypothetical protein